jgi:predicted dehydrogenase/threonine dehydrogenase-like Zn-dependent dehydrogenase
MKQVLRHGLNEIVVRDVPDPVAGPHAVVVAPRASLISTGTETASLHRGGVVGALMENPSHIQRVLAVAKANGPTATLREVRGKLRDYAVLGYSGSGVVVERHPSVTDMAVGDRVAYSGEGTGHGELIVTGRNLVAPLPPSVGFEEAAFGALGSIAMNVVRQSELQLGDTVLVIGLGLVGQLCAQLARLQGARVIATDLDEARATLARELGAEHTVSDPDLVVPAVRQLTNGAGADCAIVAAQGKSAVAPHLALAATRDRGRIVVVGAVELSFPWHEMYLKEMTVRMARAYGPGSYDPAYERDGIDYPLGYVRWTENRNLAEFMRLLETRAVAVTPLVTHRFAFGDAAAAYQTARDREAGALGVVLQYPVREGASAVRVARVAVRHGIPAGTTLGLALVGAGNIARWAHLPNIVKDRQAYVRAVVSGSGARALSYAERCGARYCTSEYREVLEDDAVHAVLITSRNREHGKQALAALAAGKHVFVEKPMALTEDECMELTSAVEQSGRVLAVGFNRRFAESYRRVRDALQQRNGPVVLNGRMNSPSIVAGYWMADPEEGGALLGEGCHFADLFAWSLGAEPVEVSAWTLPADNVVAAFRFADGSLANLTYCTVGNRAVAGERLEAYAAGITASAENFKRSSVSGGVRRQVRRWFPRKGYDGQMQAFLRAVRGEPGGDLAGVVDGARATMMCLCLLESARLGKPVAIEPAAK